MKRIIIITKLVFFSITSFSQDLTLITESCSDECPSINAFDIARGLKSELRDIASESGSGTVNAHQKGGWIVQTRELQDNGCYRYCTRLYSVADSDNCYEFTNDSDYCYIDLSQKPDEDENTRVVASYHTHPVLKADVKNLLDMELLASSDEGQGMELAGYEFTSLEATETAINTVNNPTKRDLIHTVEQGVPTIIATEAADKTAASIFGLKSYTITSDGNLSVGEEVLEPANLTWECEACIEITPVDDCIEKGETIPLEATVIGPKDKSVTWEALVGTIDETGNYTAPDQSVVDQIIATSNADPEAKDTISLGVGYCDSYWKLTISGDYSYTDSASDISTGPSYLGFITLFSDPENSMVKGRILPTPNFTDRMTGEVTATFQFTNCGAELGEPLPCEFTTMGIPAAVLNIQINNDRILKGEMRAYWNHGTLTNPQEVLEFEAYMEFVSLKKK